MVGGGDKWIVGGPILEERKNSTTQTTARKEFLILWWCGCNDVLSEETNTKDYQSSLLAVCFQTLVLLKVGGGLGNVEGWSRLVVSNFCIGRKTGVHIFCGESMFPKIEHLPDALYFVLGKVRAANALLVESKGFISLGEQ